MSDKQYAFSPGLVVGIVSLFFLGVFGLAILHGAGYV